MNTLEKALDLYQEIIEDVMHNKIDSAAKKLELIDLNDYSLSPDWRNALEILHFKIDDCINQTAGINKEDVASHFNDLIFRYKNNNAQA